MAGTALGLLVVGVAGWLSLDGKQAFLAPAEAPQAEEVAVLAPGPETTGTIPVPQPQVVEVPRADDGGPKIITVNPPERPETGGIVIRDPASIGQNLQIAHLPVTEALEIVDGRRLPVIAADGRRPLDLYARPWSGTAGPRVALVIGGLGISQTATQEAISRLPDGVTLGFASTGNSLDRWMQTARREGHEIILQVPMEPADFPKVNPGLNTLTIDAGAGENLDRLHWALGRTTNYVGVMNYMGAVFTADASALGPVIDDLGRRGLLWLDDGSSSRSRALELAGTAGVPSVRADAIIDAVRDRGSVLARLSELEQIARSQGVAVGVGTAFPDTVEAVSEWVRAARSRGVELVPVSAVALEGRR